MPPVAPSEVESNHPARQTAVRLLGLMGLGVFAALPDSYGRMVGWPWVVVWQGAFLCWAWVGFSQLRRGQQSYRRLGGGLDGVVLALFISLLLSSLTAEFPLLALQQTLQVVGYVGVLYTVCNSTTARPATAYNSTIRRVNPVVLWHGMVGMGAIAALVSLVLWQPSPEMWLSDNFATALRNRLPLGHHNFSGGYFLLVLPLATRRVACCQGWQRWGYGLASLLLGVALYSTGSRGAWLGAIVVLLVTLAIALIRSRQRWKTSLLILLILGLVGLGLLSNPRVRTFVQTASIRPGQVQLADTPALDRIYMVQATVNIVSAHPLLGVGPGNLGRVYDRYRPITAGAGLNQVQQVHNTPLNLLCELGGLGFVIYGMGLVGLLRLGWQRWHQCPQPGDRALVEACGLSLLGYSVSSLTDYQLENIPIALTLTLIVAALVRLSPPAAPPPLVSHSSRRTLSLLVLLVIGVALQFWLRTDLALWFTQRGLHALEQSELNRADAQLYKAAKIAPWDPTASALGAQVLTELAASSSTADQETLRRQAIPLYQQVLRAAPNDPWFNQNWAVLMGQTQQPELALPGLMRTVQLMPRSRNHSYALLAQTYAILGQPEQAAAALALEFLVHPDAIALDIWHGPLADLAPAALSQTIEQYEAVLAQLNAAPEQQEMIAPVQAHLATLKWWAGDAPAHADHLPVDRLFLQGLFAIDQDPEAALSLLNQCVEAAGDDRQACQLVRAWLKPDTFLADYLAEHNLSGPEAEQVRSYIDRYRDLRQWIRSTSLPVQRHRRYALMLLYRNQYANRIAAIDVPSDLSQFTLPDSLRLFPLAWPRELPALDEHIEFSRTTQLDLPHPTRNHFHLTALPPLTETP